MDESKLFEILEANKNKSFVKRILHKELYPTFDRGNGNYSTHSMAWGESDGKYVVFPTVLLNKKGTLSAYSPEEAWKHTQATGNFIEFDNPRDADWFSKNYKRYWEFSRMP